VTEAARRAVAGGAPTFVGSDTCRTCHQQAYEGWRRSDHWHAMQAATSETVLGDFNDARFDYFGHTSRFYVRNGDYVVRTENAAGEPQEFKIAYTLGYYPLQQYLIEFPDGRLQVLGISWDSRPKTDGGQRWYHLYPDEEVAFDDALHWTGAFQNWNSRCASCHTTGLAKNYSAESDSYDTRWAEIDVGCEACHGPGSRHFEWAGGNGRIANRGLLTDLRPAWEPAGGRPDIPKRASVGALDGQVELCAGCHSRREELQPRDAAAGYFDNYSLTPLLAGLYYPDGQMREEVYVTGSFLQSKMHENQVSCTNCHEPHSGRLRVEGNGLCLQCHDAGRYESEQHFFHEPGSAGAQCVSCHMPERTYMGVDARRDHSFRIPDPVASMNLGVPNACTDCHTDRTDRWAAEILARRTGRTDSDSRYGHAAVLAAARNDDVSVAPKLLALANDSNEPAVLRSIALIESARFPSTAQLDTVRTALASPEPLIRLSAPSALSFLDPAARLRYLAPLLDDPAKAVRMAAARQLIDLRPEQVPAPLRPKLNARLSEYERSLAFNADRPEALSDLGLLYAAGGDLQKAEQALLKARKLAPRYLAAMINLADVYRAESRDDLGEPVLDEALRAYPDSGDASYALGLLYVRTGRAPDSAALFERASRLSPANAEYALVYAVALAETGKREQGVEVLRDAMERFPGNPQIRDAYEALSAPDARR
jgi:predicted CXXCH cytochrome family protein